MALVSGYRGTGSVLADRRKYDVADKLHMISPEAAVLAVLTRKLNKKKAIDPEFRWFEKEQPSRYDAANGSFSASATTITVDDGTKFRAGDVITNVSSGEHMLVTAVSGNDLTVTRAWGTTSAATINDNDVIVILGNANEEGAASRTSLTSQAVKKYNYTQIFREPFAVTGTEAATELYGAKSDIVALRKEHLDIHLKDIERAFLFGEPKEDTSGSHPRRATGGLEYFIQTNIKDVATLTETEFEDWLQDVFAKGNTQKLLIASPLIVSALNSWGRGKLQLVPESKKYGLAITEYLSAHGSLKIVEDRLLAENSVWNGMAFCVDLAKIAYRYLSANGENRDTHLRKNIQAPDYDGEKDEYLSEVGLMVIDEASHGILKGVTSYS